MYQYVLGGGSIFYNPLEKHDYSKDYFTIVALEDGQFKFIVEGCGGTPVDSHYYSIDNGQTWTELPIGTDTPTISAGNKILWKNNMSTGEMAGTVSSTGIFEAQGNVMSLVYGDNFANQTSLEGYNFALRQLFSNSNIKKTNNLLLPATTLAQFCYQYMFRGCTNLTTAPELPATTLNTNCYAFMFEGCTSLTTAPELPATTLADSCYAYMFNGCTSLTTAPVLPATTLASGCYSYMFGACTSLTTAPVLSATTLVNTCYSRMFTGCTSLNSITCLATNISANSCTSEWVSGVAATGTFTKAVGTNWTTGTSGIPNGWTVKP